MSKRFEYDEVVKTTSSPARLSKLLIVLLALAASVGGLTAAPNPSVSVFASPSTIDRESLQPAYYTISLSAPASRDVAVVFYMTGTARLNFDYTLSGNFVGGQIVIPAGQTATTVTLRPLRLDAHLIRETASMNLVHDTRVPHTYALGSPIRATVTLVVE